MRLPPRALPLSAALAATGCLVAHLVHPGVFFPLELLPWAAGTALLFLTVAPVPDLARPVVAVVAAGLLFVGGLPAAHTATFPWVELGRARPPEWEDIAGVGLLASAAIVTVPERGRRARTAVKAGLGLLAAAALGATLLYPVKANFQVIGPAAPGIATVPMLDGSGTTAVRWARKDVESAALVALPAMIQDEWRLMDLAGGIHQEASPSWLRLGLWRALEGVAALAWALRVASLPAALAAVRVPRLGWIPELALLLVPTANLVASVPGLLLADDRALRPGAFVSSLTTLLVCAVASRGRR